MLHSLHFVSMVLLTTFLLLHQIVVTLSDNLQLEYFTSAVLECNENSLNFTNSANINRRYWLIPAGVLLNKSSTDKHVQVDFNFTLTINEINDSDFGKYYCLLTRSDYSVDTIEHGINVDGPYYGNLPEIYSKRAMIGGIAAGSLFVVATGSCLLWQLNYVKKNRYNKKADKLHQLLNELDMKAYDNIGMEPDEMNGEIQSKVGSSEYQFYS